MADFWDASGKQKYVAGLNIEPERFEVVGDVDGGITRRLAAVLGVGAVFALRLSGQEKEFARLHRGENGVVTLLTGKAELGQGLSTLCAQAVAEEMGIGVEKVRVICGDTSICPDDGGTWGSMTTPFTIPLIRKAAAAAAGRGEVKAPGNWRVLGTPVKNVLGRDIVTGALKYSSDVKVAGMERRTVPHAGVTIAGLEAMTAGYKKTAKTPVASPTGARYPAVLFAGDVSSLREDFTAGANVVRAEFTLKHIAHVPLEPRAAVAEWKDGRVTVWTGSQAPFLVRADVARAFGMGEGKVRVVNCPVGSGYGGKQRGEVEVEAAKLARDLGKPVKVSWSRSDEFLAGYFRPGGVIEVSAKLDGAQRISHWDFHNYNAGATGLKHPYAIENYYCGWHACEAAARQGSYRSLAAVGNAFAREGMVDLLAAKVGADRVEFRMKNLREGRTRELLVRAAEKFGWGKKKGEGYGEGVAVNLEKDGHLACFVGLRVVGKVVKLERVVVAFDGGAVLNPLGLENQVAGGVAQGIGGALFEKVEGVVKPRLSAYRVPRFSDVPKIEVILVDRKDVASAGAGESPITGIAPAIAGAIEMATGRRLMGMPLEL